MKSTADIFKVIRVFLVVNILGNIVLNIRDSGVLFYANLIFFIITLQMQYDRKEERNENLHRLFIFLDILIVVLAAIYLLALPNLGI
jgi:hypothetical protein